MRVNADAHACSRGFRGRRKVRRATVEPECHSQDRFVAAARRHPRPISRQSPRSGIWSSANFPSWRRSDSKRRTRDFAGNRTSRGADVGGKGTLI